MKKFKVMQRLSANSICDHNCIWTDVVKKVNPKTVVLAHYGLNKIHLDYHGDEFCYFLGKYSMAPVFSA